MKKQLSFQRFALALILFFPMLGNGWNANTAEVEGVLTNGNLVVSAGQKKVKDSGVTPGTFTDALAEKSDQGDMDAVIGNIEDSYVIISGTESVDGKYEFYTTFNSRPSYGDEARPAYNAGIWTIFGPITYTNPATSYLPPYDGWYASGVATNITVEWFSGQDAGKVGTNDFQALETNFGTVSNDFRTLETLVENSSNDWNTAYSTSINNAADIDALETEVDGIGNVVWFTSSDQAFVSIGTNDFYIFATPSPTDTVFSIGEWTVTTTNATLAVGTNTVEVRP